MVIEFKLPDLGEGVAEGEIVKWLVSEGQEIKEDSPMVEVMTDKATVQIPSPATAKVKQILAKEGQTVKVGTNLVILDEGGTSQIGRTQTQQHQPSPSSQSQVVRSISTEDSRNSSRVLATPALRKLARELGVEIEQVKGTGPSGRVTESDVRGSLAVQSRTSSAQAIENPQTQSVVLKSQASELGNRKEEERIPIHGIRKRIAEKMMKASTATAAVTHMEEVDFEELVSLRERAKPLAERNGVKLTFLPFIMKAAVAALKQYPYFNSSIDEEKQEIILKHYYNIGFATDTPNGLVVPVVKEVDRKNIFEIARDISSLSEAARSGRIGLDDIQGGTFTITNIGNLGGILSTPIINFPEVAILGVHKIQKRPVVREDQIMIREVANIALTFDHRVQDGADAARFTGTIVKYLENPGLLFLEFSLGSQ